MKRGGPRGGSSGSPENEAGAGQCCEPVGCERCSTAAAVRFRPPCLLPSGRVTLSRAVSRSKCHRLCRGVPSTPYGPALAASLSLPVSLLASLSLGRSQPFRSGYDQSCPPATSVGLSSRKSERASRAPQTHARRHLRRLHRAPWRERAGGRPRAARTSGTRRASR